MTEGAWLQDPDVTLYHGDVLATLRELPAESVDCVVTSPPYWGLRDYGTGAWEGGDVGCDHVERTMKPSEKSTLEDHGEDGRSPQLDALPGIPYRHVCAKCGATRIDQQLGLEPTPEQYVERMVEVFREVRRVLAPHGTVWLNLGDSYAGAGYSNHLNTGGAQREDGGKQWHTRVRTNAGEVIYQEPRASSLKSKDLVGIPWRVAFALQADGWYLRSDIIWSKPNPMPESVTDRPTKAHEYVFLLSKQPRYFFDQEAVREPHTTTVHRLTKPTDEYAHGLTPEEVAGRKVQRGGKALAYAYTDGVQGNPAGRNIRSVWEIATQPYPEAHFATFPEELARRCIAAGCPEQVCRVCGKARERITEHGAVTSTGGSKTGARATNLETVSPNGQTPDNAYNTGAFVAREKHTLGFSDCGHADYRLGVTLDPFIGSGTVAHVARKLGRHAVGIDLSAEYLELAARRLQQQSLFAEAT